MFKLFKSYRLTAQQETDLREWWRRWYAAGVSTSSADRQRAEAAVTAMYRHLHRPSPAFVWVPSPATGMLAQQTLGTKKADLGASLWAALGRQGLEDSLWAGLRANLKDTLRDSLWSSLGASLGVSLKDNLGTSLWRGLRDSSQDSPWAYHWGQHQAYWVGYYKFCEHIGVRYLPERAAQLQWWADLAESCGWWAPYERVAIMCERPEICSMEPTGRTLGGMPTYRLHADAGPALRFRDGYAAWVWHGVRVPQKLIEQPWDVTRRDLVRERNAEVQRAYRERLGTKRFAALTDLVERDRDEVGAGAYRQQYILWRTRERDELVGDYIQFVEARCHSTGRQYMLCVPPDIGNVYSAVAWTFGKKRKTYAPAVEA